MKISIDELKVNIIKKLDLQDIAPEDIGNNDELFGPDLGLDSIDALELVVMLDEKYGIKIENPEDGKKVFTTVSGIAQYIEKHL